MLVFDWYSFISWSTSACLKSLLLLTPTKQFCIRWYPKNSLEQTHSLCLIRNLATGLLCSCDYESCRRRCYCCCGCGCGGCGCGGCGCGCGLVVVVIVCCCWLWSIRHSCANANRFWKELKSSAMDRVCNLLIAFVCTIVSSSYWFIVDLSFRNQYLVIQSKILKNCMRLKIGKVCMCMWCMCTKKLICSFRSTIHCSRSQYHFTTTSDLTAIIWWKNIPNYPWGFYLLLWRMYFTAQWCGWLIWMWC